MSEEKKRPRVWLVRAGAHGEDEEFALEKNVLMIEFRKVGDLTHAATYKGVSEIVRKAYPERKTKAIGTISGQLWAFSIAMREDDIVCLPRKRTAQVALGRIAGPYVYQKIGDELRHTRTVEWIRTDVPRSSFRQDLLRSLGAFLTVCRITRNEAERRISAVLAGGDDPGYEVKKEHEKHELTSDEDARLDIAQAAHDEITAYIRTKFQGHDMARLVEAVLQADGFLTRRSMPGPDGGADILGGRGPLGLDAPNLCVQVKATEAPVDVAVFRQLQGTMESFGASQGLLVCWGGFKGTVRMEARQHAFRIVLWDQSDLVRAIYRTYDNLPAEIQAELPLKQVRVLVREDLEEEG